MDWYFRISSTDNFIQDLNNFCLVIGYEPMFPDNVITSCTLRQFIRFDFDVFEIGSFTNPVMHINVRGTLLPHTDQLIAQETLEQINAQIVGFFATLPTITNPDPADFPGQGGQVWHSTADGTVLIDTVNVPKRLWA